MLLSDVQIRVKQQFGDTSGAQIQDADIARWASDTQLDIVRRTKCNEVTVTVLSVVGQESYLPTNILDVNRVEYNGARLRFVSRNELDMRFPTRHIPNYGNDTPQWYYVTEGSLSLFPSPVAAGDNITVLYNRRPADVVNPGDAFEIPPQYHENIVRRCLQRAYELDGQWQAADRMASDYTAQVSFSAAEHKDKNDDSYPAIRCLPGDYGGVF